MIIMVVGGAVDKTSKQAEAEVVPSSSLVEVEVGLRLGLGSRCSSVFLLFRVGWGGWRS